MRHVYNHPNTIHLFDGRDRRAEHVAVQCAPRRKTVGLEHERGGVQFQSAIEVFLARFQHGQCDFASLLNPLIRR
jgi:hypothetical protein